MNAFRIIFRPAMLALCAVGLLASPAMAMPVGSPFVPPDNTGFIMPVASDCYAVGQEVAAQKGGTLAKASQSTQGGKPVCVIVVLVPGKEGERPRRSEVVVPQN